MSIISHFIRKYARPACYGFAVALLVACGGGGGDAGISYTGNTDPADIDGTNAEELSTGAVTVGQAGGAVGGFDSSTAGSRKVGLNTSKITQAIVAAVENELNAGASPSVGISVVVNDSFSDAGPCGGNMTTNVSVEKDIAPYPFDGSINFNNFCENGETVSGTISFDGQFISGTSVVGFDITIGSILIKDAAGDVYKFQDFNMSIVANLSVIGLITSMDVTITSGSFFAPAYGYVLVKTTTPLHYQGTSEWPSSGVLEIIEDATPPVDRVILTAFPTQYLVEIDIDNDLTINDFFYGDWADL